ncbi:15578_t:CDS:2 [Rhizophagus irregularis]|nr:15578_t:CDS:2 [Rhizophagus irregularis]
MESYDHLIKYNEDGSIKSLRASQLVNERIITINIYDEELSIKRKRAENDIFEKQIQDIEAGATEADLSQEVVKNRDIYNNKQLKDLLYMMIVEWQDLLKPRDHVLYYHTPDLSSPEDSPERNYYQLIVSDNLWLKNYCFCIDENNELNIMEQATILAIVVELPSSIP